MPFSIIRLSAHHFRIEDRFVPGHPLSEAEASALNGLLADTVRTNLSKRPRFRRDAPPLSPLELLEVQTLVETYAREYVFPPARRSSIPPPSPLEIEIFRVAQEEAEIRTRAKGLSEEGEVFALLLAETRADPKVRAEAERRLSVRGEVSRDALLTLFGGASP